jgi:hypothetical protein
VGLWPTLVGLFVLCASLLACGGSDATTSGSTGGDDGRFRPEPSGLGIDETDACERVRVAIESTASELGCIVTLQACPNLLRATGNAACSTYDEGTVDGCSAYFRESTSCDELDARRENCVFATIGEAACP